MSPASTPLTALRSLRAEFKSGLSALGHHWELFDGSDQSVGRTKRVYEGVGGKLGKRLAVATGLSTVGSIEVNVLSATGEHLATFRGKGGERTIGRLSAPDGQLIGVAEHERDVQVLLQDAAGRTVGRILTPPDPTDAAQDRAGVLFPIHDAAGREIGRMARTRQALASLPKLSDEVLGLPGSELSYEADLTRYRGFRNSSNYLVELSDGARPAEPLATLAILSPVLAGYLY